MPISIPSRTEVIDESQKKCELRMMLELGVNIP